MNPWRRTCPSASLAHQHWLRQLRAICSRWSSSPTTTRTPRRRRWPGPRSTGHLATPDGKVAQRSASTPGQKAILAALNLAEPPQFLELSITDQD